MQNKLSDLNNHLFAEIERLSDEALKGNKLTEEIQRSIAISNIDKRVIENCNLVVSALKAEGEVKVKLPILLGD
jgi:hypothetical protein